MKVKIDPSWQLHLQPTFEAPYFTELVAFVKNAYQRTKVYPPGEAIFRAFSLSKFEDTRVVILGQDPYHGPRQANGLCFAVNEGIRIPPSLRNIFKELKDDIGSQATQSDLLHWANQGVLLLNATLTVQAHTAGSHQHKGWAQFTDAVIRLVAEKKEHVVFILWGAYAQRKGAFIDTERHLVLRSPHPSPFSADRGFFGSKPFSQANAYLVAHGKPPIAW